MNYLVIAGVLVGVLVLLLVVCAFLPYRPTGRTAPRNEEPSYYDNSSTKVAAGIGFAVGYGAGVDACDSSDSSTGGGE